MITDLSRFKQPDELRTVSYCGECEGDIYEGDEITWFQNGVIVHEACERSYTYRVFVDRREIIGE